MSLKRNIPVVVVAVLVAAFVSLYPVMDCEDHGCPSAVHSALGAASATCVVVVLGAMAFAAPNILRSLSLLRFRTVAMYSQTCISALFRPPKD